MSALSVHIAIYSREYHLFSKFYDLNSIVVTIVNQALLKIRYTTWKDILARRLMLTSLLFEFVCSYESDNIYQNIDGFLQVRFENTLDVFRTLKISLSVLMERKTAWRHDYFEGQR